MIIPPLHFFLSLIAKKLLKRKVHKNNFHIKTKQRDDQMARSQSEGCPTERLFNATSPYRARPKGTYALNRCQVLPHMRAARPSQGRATVRVSPPSRYLLYKLTPVFNKDLSPRLLFAFFGLSPLYLVL